MTQLHSVYLILGSNIQPEINLQRAIDILGTYGTVETASSVWESRAVGSSGPNFLNAAVLFLTATGTSELKDKIIRPTEELLGRVRVEDRNAARTIDIDVMMVDGKPLNLDRWYYAFVVLPMAELLPDLPHPIGQDKLKDAAAKIRAQTWMAEHREISLSLRSV